MWDAVGPKEIFQKALLWASQEGIFILLGLFSLQRL